MNLAISTPSLKTTMDEDDVDIDVEDPHDWQSDDEKLVELDSNLNDERMKWDIVSEYSTTSERVLSPGVCEALESGSCCSSNSGYDAVKDGRNIHGKRKPHHSTTGGIPAVNSRSYVVGVNNSRPVDSDNASLPLEETTHDGKLCESNISNEEEHNEYMENVRSSSSQSNQTDVEGIGNSMVSSGGKPAPKQQTSSECSIGGDSQHECCGYTNSGQKQNTTEGVKLNTNFEPDDGTEITETVSFSTISHSGNATFQYAAPKKKKSTKSRRKIASPEWHIPMVSSVSSLDSVNVGPEGIIREIDSLRLDDNKGAMDVVRDSIRARPPIPMYADEDLLGEDDKEDDYEIWDLKSRDRQNRVVKVTHRTDVQKIVKAMQAMQAQKEQERDIGSVDNGADSRDVLGARMLKSILMDEKALEEILGRSIMLSVDDPYQRFRRMARVILIIVKACRICKDFVYQSVSSEDWFKLIGEYVSDDFVEDAPRRPRPFTTFVQPEGTDDMVKLTFDKSEFSREYSADYLLTDDVREILQKSPDTRTAPQLYEMMRFLKRVSIVFNSYPLETQKRLVKHMFYDRYMPHRVIVKENMMADGVYFVLSGALLEKKNAKKSLRELKPGDRFGEEDLICGCPRKSTVVTKTSVELVSVHRKDYRAIFNMADDSNNPKYLEVCRQNIVFQHFPMKLIIQNPGVWTVLSYKFGRLIAENSNDVEWIYIIKSGEARVIKHLTMGAVAVQSRKARQTEKLKLEPWHETQEMMKFVGHKSTSNYRRGMYTPFQVAKIQRIAAQSAPPIGTRQKQNLSCGSVPVTPLRRSRTALASHRSPSPHNTLISPIPHPLCDDPTSRVQFEQNHQKRSLGGADESRPHRKVSTEVSPQNCSTPVIRIHSASNSPRTKYSSSAKDEPRHRRSWKSNQNLVEDDETEEILQTAAANTVPGAEDALRRKLAQGHRGFTVQTGPAGRPLTRGRTKLRASTAGARKPEKFVRVPPFVQIESLHAGRVFGFRSCLEPEERGPSASLVSGGCEVLQVNRKFFLNHVDEALLSLINLNNKPFPTDEELLDRLDANLEWQGYKETTVLQHLRHRGRTAATYRDGDFFVA